MKNPFALSFGVKPDNYVPRIVQTDEIVAAFESDAQSVYAITGVRGSGKTVMLTSVSEAFEMKEDWIVVELISEADMLDQLAARLYDCVRLRKIIDGATFGFSFQGISFSIKGEKPITSVVTLLEELLGRIAKKGKKVLICVDEAISNAFMKPFVQAFQMLIRKRYPIKLLFTGLYQNIMELQENKSLTFLYRAPKIALGPLHIPMIASAYKASLGIGDDEALALAKFTKGFAFAYQVLGHLLFESGKKAPDEAILASFDQYMSEYVYEKSWRQCSPSDRKVLLAFDGEQPQKVSALIEKSGMNEKTFSVYRSRLIRKGLVASEGYGLASLALPRFHEFIQTQAI